MRLTHRTAARLLPVLPVLATCAVASALRAALPTPDPDDGGLTLPPGFRALVVADDLVVNRKVGGRANNLRFITVAPNGDLYAKTKRGSLLACCATPTATAAWTS